MAVMPAHIASLPRDRNGIPVTWAAAWSSELQIEVRTDPLLTPILGSDTRAYFSLGDQYMGEPKVALPQPQRVRRCVIEGICQVCGRTIDGPRYVCDIRLGEEWFRAGKRLVPLLIDAWTCGGCIDFSLRTCPNLRRRTHLDVLRVTDWLPIPSLERPKWIPDSEPYGPIGFVKIAALKYETFETRPSEGMPI